MENKKLWFKEKSYGWGWTPATWEGWVVVLLFILAVVGSAFFVIGPQSQGEKVTSTHIIKMLAVDVLLLGALLRICSLRGPRPTWRWGDKK